MQRSSVRCQVLNVSVSGFTLLELVVAISLFLMVVALSTGVFVNALRTQREILKITAANGNVSQAIEQIAREIRTGHDFQNSTQSEIKFINYRGDRVGYRMIDGGLIGRCADPIVLCTDSDTYTPITSEKVRVSTVNFRYMGISKTDDLPTRVTIVIGVEGIKGVENYFQTTVSSKILDG